MMLAVKLIAPTQYSIDDLPNSVFQTVQSYSPSYEKDCPMGIRSLTLNDKVTNPRTITPVEQTVSRLSRRVLTGQLPIPEAISRLILSNVTDWVLKRLTK